MHVATETSVRGIWREHVLAAVAWDELRTDGVSDLAFHVGICLDLFVGGTVCHELGDGGLVCRGCEADGSEHWRGLCEVHLGIVEAFLQGMTGIGHRAERRLEGGKCKIVLQPG